MAWRNNGVTYDDIGAEMQPHSEGDIARYIWRRHQNNALPLRADGKCYLSWHYH